MSDIDFPTEIEASGVIGRVDENWRAKFDALKSGYKEPVDNMTDEQLLQRGLVRLPVDADGVPIHVGDPLDGYGKTIEVVEMRYGRGGWVLISRDGSGYADTFAFTHHHEPTVEDELRDYGRRLVSNASPFNCTFGDIRAYQDELADRIDAGMVELPKDADGEYIHIGDVMEWCDSGETLTVEGIGRDVLFYIDGENAEWTAARNKRHYHAPTVEDVLREFADEVQRCCDTQDTIAEYAARLRLAGDGE